jgi:hypothetical protein
VNLEQLVIEFKARGFDYMATNRCENYLNDAYILDICESADWPFLEASTEAKAPLEIADLSAVRYVIDVTQERKLKPLKKDRITDDYNVNLATPGSPSFYYLEGGDTVKVFPVSTADTMQVAYWKTASRLTSGTETPIFPERFHSVIVDGAVSRAYEDSDDYELANASKERFNARLQAMQDALTSLQHDDADDHVVITDLAALGSWGW